MRYFDTGVLLKLYLPEPRAVEAASFVNGCGNLPPVTPLHEMEMRSALRQKAGRGEISVSECEMLIAQLDADLGGGVHRRTGVVWSDVFDTVESLSAAHGVKTLLPVIGHAARRYGVGTGSHGVLYV